VGIGQPSIYGVRDIDTGGGPRLVILRNLCNRQDAIGNRLAAPMDIEVARQALRIYAFLDTAGALPPSTEFTAMQKHIGKGKAAARTKPGTATKADTGSHARDLRTALAWLKSQGDLIETDKAVDPDLEITGLQKHMDGGCPVMFNNVKGKPKHRVITNLFGDINVINKMFGWTSDAERVRKLAQALRKPLRPEIIAQDEAPTQEHIIKNPKDVNEW